MCPDTHRNYSSHKNSHLPRASAEVFPPVKYENAHTISVTDTNLYRRTHYHHRELHGCTGIPISVGESPLGHSKKPNDRRTPQAFTVLEDAAKAVLLRSSRWETGCADIIANAPSLQKYN